MFIQHIFFLGHMYFKGNFDKAQIIDQSLYLCKTRVSESNYLMASHLTRQCE